VSTLPALSAVVLDDAAALWIGAFAAPGAPRRRWWVLSADGRPIGRVDLPSAGDPIFPGRSELLDVSGRRLAIRRQDPGGEPSVEIWSLTGS
jgi:hypothetical protein